jgi:ferredoxin-NADP reductase
MEGYPVRILSITEITHNVRQFNVEKPKGYVFTPGQATDVSLTEEAWKDQLRPFTFTGLNEWDHLQFTIKIYPERKGVTDQLGHRTVGQSILIHDVWGAIQYMGEGTFIAGGAGVTPFIAIFRQLHKDGMIGKNRLIFSNKTEGDIIMKEQWDEWLGPNVQYVLTDGKTRIHEKWLKEHIKNFNQHFYVCGPDSMVAEIKKALENLGASGMITIEL